jgi:trans-L-3-hydroxyproline dehydratase
VAVGETITIESILGRHSVFEGRVVEEARFGPYPRIIPEVSGRAFLTGRHKFVLDPDDPLGAGVLL